MDLAKMVNTKEILAELAMQNDEFDLFEFFDRNKNIYLGEGACGFISRKQEFYCYSPSSHSYVFENVGGALYDNGSTVELNEYYKVFNPYYNNSSGRDNSNDAWRYANGDFGLISIQMLSYGYCFIWLPEVINSFQKEKLLEFSKEVNKINEHLKENGFSELDINMNVMKNHEYSSSMSLQEYIDKIDNYVDDNCNCPYENMISEYSIRSIQR